MTLYVINSNKLLFLRLLGETNSRKWTIFATDVEKNNDIRMLVNPNRNNESERAILIPHNPAIPPFIW